MLGADKAHLSFLAPSLFTLVFRDKDISSGRIFIFSIGLEKIDQVYIILVRKLYRILFIQNDSCDPSCYFDP
jgi:hypothetical protein